jgi:hypothetical protein
MRSLARKANDYVEILRLAGIPVSCDATAGTSRRRRSATCSRLLKVLDNPKRDIELATVLRSAVFPGQRHGTGEDPPVRPGEAVETRGFPRLRRVLPGRGPDQT